MSKMAELEQIIKDLRSTATALTETADSLYQMFSGTDEVKEEAVLAPVKKEPDNPKLTLTDVRSILADKTICNGPTFVTSWIYL